ncbi:MAG: V-type ATP synthase subunit F [Candidatus Methanofastidiosia archaeon]|jgi:V/A-type H+-transporting ATPase subunit F
MSEEQNKNKKQKDMAIIADRETGLAFGSMGLKALHAETVEETRNVLREASKKYKIIFVTENLAQGVTDVITEYATQTLPIIIEVPSFEGTVGLGKQKMKRITERAVGADILFKEE